MTTAVEDWDMKDEKSRISFIFPKEDPILTVDRVTIEEMAQGLNDLSRMNAEKDSNRR